MSTGKHDLAAAAREAPEVLVIRAGGRLALEGGVTALRSLMRRALRRRPATIVLDLSRTTEIDSSGLAELISSHETAAESGCRLQLAGVDRRLQKVLRVTRLHLLFEILGQEALPFRRLPAPPSFRAAA